MTKALNFYGFPVGQGTYEDLSESQRNIIETLVEGAFKSSGVETYNPTLEHIEHVGRDGFIPRSHNKGGVDMRGFTDILSLISSGRYNRDLQSIIDKADDYMRMGFLADNKEALLKHGITTYDQLCYGVLRDLEYDLADAFVDYEIESLSSSESSVMYEIRAMYHGVDSGIHSMTIFASVGASDAPYHRTTDVSEEVLITWKTDNGLKTRLAKALKSVVKKAF